MLVEGYSTRSVCAMAEWYVDISTNFGTSTPNNGTADSPFGRYETGLFVAGTTINGATCQDGDVLRVRGEYLVTSPTTIEIFRYCVFSITIKAWPDGAPWKMRVYASTPLVYFGISNRQNKHLKITDGIIYGANLVNDNTSTPCYGSKITMSNCLIYLGLYIDSSYNGVSSVFYIKNNTINSDIRLLGVNHVNQGHVTFTDNIILYGINDFYDWHTLKFEHTNIFNESYANLSATLDGTLNQIGWDTCTFEYGLSGGFISGYFTDLDEANDLNYTDYDLPIVSPPSRWSSDGQSTGFYGYTRYGYGAFVFLPLILGINADPEVGTAPLEVQFSAEFTEDLIDEQEEIEWDFGDGTQSNESSPVHVYIPGVYTACLTAISIAGITETECVTIYVYENDYSAGGRNITKTTKIFRFGIPQEKKQGIGWSEYNGADFPNAIGLIGTCRIFNEYDEERIIVTDCNTFKHYWLGKEDHWVDGGNEEYGGTEIDSEILLRELSSEVGATGKIRHSESKAGLKPWLKTRRNIGNYGQHGFKTEFKASMFFREDSSPDDRAVIKYFPRLAQIVSDRHIESESLQAGLRITGAPWRLINIQQFYEEIDTGAAPAEKQMSEKTWAEMLTESLIWIGRSIELVNIDDGSHVLPWDKGSNQRTTGSFTGVTDGPDGKSRSAIIFGSSDYLSVDQNIASGDFSALLWIKSPADGCILMSASGIEIVLDNNDETWLLNWNNEWSVALESSLYSWTMLAVVRENQTIRIYENGVLLDTRHVGDSVGYSGPVVFYTNGATGFEPRIIQNALTNNAIEWVYNDVVENNGNATCGMY